MCVGFVYMYVYEACYSNLLCICRVYQYMRPVLLNIILCLLLYIYIIIYIVYIQTIEQKMLQYHIVYIYTCFVKGATVTPVLLTC